MIASWWLAVAMAQEPACPDVDDALAVVENAAALADVERARAAAETVVTAFSCGAVASPDRVARLWIGQAAIMMALGAEESADEALAAAARLSPGTFPDAYGDALRQRHAAASTRPPPTNGSLDAFPMPDRYVAAVDGERVELPHAVTAGPHLLQIGPRRGPMVFAQAVTVAPDTDFMVDTALPQTVTPVRRRRPVLIGVGLGLGAAGLGLLTASIPTRQAARRAYDEEQFERGDAWVTVNHATVISGVAALGLGGGFVIAARW